MTYTARFKLSDGSPHLFNVVAEDARAAAVKAIQSMTNAGCELDSTFVRVSSNSLPSETDARTDVFHAEDFEAGFSATDDTTRRMTIGW